MRTSVLSLGLTCPLALAFDVVLSRSGALRIMIPSAAAAMYDNGPSRDANQDLTLDTGINIEDLRLGTGDTVVQVGQRVNVQYALKRSNGYSVDSSAQNDGVPFIFTVGDPNGAIQGLDQGIRGMRVGGIRRIIIPPKLAYTQGVEDGKPGPIPSGFGPKQRIRRVMELLSDVPGEFIVLDVKVTRIQ